MVGGQPKPANPDLIYIFKKQYYRKTRTKKTVKITVKNGINKTAKKILKTICAESNQVTKGIIAVKKIKKTRFRVLTILVQAKHAL